MPNISIFDLSAATAAPVAAAVLPIVDTADTFESPEGTTKKLTVTQLFTSPTFTPTTGVLLSAATTAGSVLYAALNAVSTSMRFGIENNAGGTVFPGVATTAFATVFGSPSSFPVEFVAGTTVQLRLQDPAHGNRVTAGPGLDTIDGPLVANRSSSTGAPVQARPSSAVFTGASILSSAVAAASVAYEHFQALSAGVMVAQIVGDGSATFTGPLGVNTPRVLLGNGQNAGVHLTRNTGTADVPTLYFDAGTDDLTIEVGGPILRFRDTGAGVMASLTQTGAFKVLAGFGCNGANAQTAAASGGAAPTGGTGATAGAYDTAAHRDALITLVNNIRAALVANGIMT